MPRGAMSKTRGSKLRKLFSDAVVHNDIGATRILLDERGCSDVDLAEQLALAVRYAGLEMAQLFVDAGARFSNWMVGSCILNGRTDLWTMWNGCSRRVGSIRTCRKMRR